MRQRSHLKHPVALVAILAAACGAPTRPEGPGPAALLSVTAGDAQTAVVGTLLPNPLEVTVTDSQARPVPNAVVAWSVTFGDGAVNPGTTTTDAAGIARTNFTLGRAAGTDTVKASVTGVTKVTKITITGIPGPLVRVAVASHILVLCGVDSGHVFATAADQFGNPVAGTVTWESRDPLVVTVDASGAVHLLSPTGSTYLVARSGTAAPDSVQVQGGSPLVLNVAQVDTTLPASSFCLGSTAAKSEFVLAAFFGSDTPGDSAVIAVAGSGVALVSPLANLANLANRAAVPAGHRPLLDVQPDLAFEYGLRERERQEMPRYARRARAWHTDMQRQRAAIRSAGPVGGGRATRQQSVGVGLPVDQQIPANAAVGDMVQLNTNATAFCSNPVVVTARIAAISNTAIVVNDQSNPAGGFTDAEYASFAAAMDTLVMPVDTTAFGTPSDIDNNGRVVIFFTKAVNELTTDPSNGVVLGFFYGRDLLPTAQCAGSNQAELFYLVVPDPSGKINGGNTFTKSKQNVSNIVVSTIAHEFQHLINASRRMYINHSPVTSEVSWLNEGLSHIAEELIFYRASGLGPRQDIGIGALSNSAVYNAFGLYMWGNRSRYKLLLAVVERHGPIGEHPDDDDLTTRGASWSFLRYLADQRPADPSFFFRLVNSQTSGLANLQDVLGADPRPFMRHWSAALYTNGTIPGIDPAWNQPSWNWPEVFALTAGGGLYPASHTVTGFASDTVAIKADAGAYFRFAVGNGQQALIAVTSPSGGAPPSSIKLTLIRAK